MKVMFTVQAEGRGHMTQAIAVQEMLRQHNHKVVAVLAGGNPSRNLPPFFEQSFDKVQRIASPGFASNKNRDISILGTGIQLIKNLPSYRRSLAAIRSAIEEHQPDLIMNFLEPLMGLYNLLHRNPVPVPAVGHQFMLEHPSYLKVKEFKAQQIGMKYYVRITGARSSYLALSFYSAADQPEKNLIVCPPFSAANSSTSPPKKETVSSSTS